MTSIVILVELESDSTKLVKYISEQSMTTRKPNLQQGHRDLYLKKKKKKTESKTQKKNESSDTNQQQQQHLQPFK
jgi:hypothetical protein